MSGEQKVSLFNMVFKSSLIVIGTLISIIFYGLLGKVESIDTTTTTIRIQMQHVEDKVDTHGDAINEIKKEVDYLQKVKKDK